MILYSSQFLHQIEKYNDLTMTQVVQNLAWWTRRLQVCIGEAFVSGDIEALNVICTDPSEFLSIHHQPDADDTPDTGLSQPYTMYRKKSYWMDCISSILTLCATSEDKTIQLEMLSVLNYLTRFDLPPSETWDTLMSEYSLIEVLRNIISQPMKHRDFKLEILFFCNEMCYCGTSAGLIADTNFVHDLVGLWGDCEDDVEIQIRILSLCETLLSYEETRSTILFGTGKEVSMVFSFIVYTYIPLTYNHHTVRFINLQK